MSPVTIRSLARGCVRLYRVTKNFAHLSCCCPSEAAAPVMGAATPMVRVLPHAIVAMSAEAGAAVEPARSELELPP